MKVRIYVAVSTLIDDPTSQTGKRNIAVVKERNRVPFGMQTDALAAQLAEAAVDRLRTITAGGR